MSVMIAVGYNIEAEELKPLLVYQEFRVNREMVENLCRKAYGEEGFNHIEFLNIGSDNDFVFDINSEKIGVLIKVKKEYNDNGKLSRIDIQDMEVSGFFEIKCSLQKIARYLQDEVTDPNVKYCYLELPGRGFL